RRVLRCEDGWPALELREDQGIAQGMRANWNLVAWLLHGGGLSVGHHEQPRLQLLSEEIPDGMCWVDMEVLPLPNARPWQLPSWPSQAQKRLDSTLGTSGLRKLDDLSVGDVNDLACVMWAATDKGAVYLKVSDSPREAAVTEYLSKTLPDLLPPVLWVDPSSNSLLTLSGGKLLDMVSELDAWTEAARRLAHFQQNADAHALAALGCPAFPLLEMAGRVDSFLADLNTLRAWGLEESCLETLCAARPAIRTAFADLAALNLPDLPAHGDAHPRNALSGQRGAVWFDWAETASAAHPFMDMGWFLAFTFDPAGVELPIRTAYPDLEKRLIEAYLSALGCVDAASLLSSAVPLALLHRAVVYDARFRNWEGTLPGWRPNFVPYYLRLAARELARLPS
ncbi:phosphotransferase, partial [Deinococcus marmoris]